MEETFKVALLGGQGCPTLFSSRAAEKAVENLKSSPLAGILLSRCHAAYLNELLLTSSDNTLQFSNEFLAQRELQAFLNPPPSLQSHPVVQGTTLCVHQLLEYLACNGPSSNQVNTTWPTNTSEVVGFCSGVLPAVVIASCATVEEYFEASVQAVRIAFHLGRRVAEFCKGRLGRNWREQGSWAVAAIQKDIDVGSLRELIDDFNHSLEVRVSNHDVDLQRALAD